MSIRLLLPSVIVLAGLLASSGCGKTPPRVVPDSIASDASQKAIELFDSNKDGVLDASELDQAPGLKAGILPILVQAKKLELARLDEKAIKDEVRRATITASDIQARIDQWKKSKAGRRIVQCTVTHNGQPLADATVVVDPEPFLGSGLKAGSGQTDASGRASLSVPTSGTTDQTGLSPGYYRIRVTKPGESIPAIYNTQTSLGLEISDDNPQLRGGPKFELRY
jgi:hypothetical protein